MKKLIIHILEKRADTKVIKIKICGITRKEDAVFAAGQGAWAVGFIFVKSSPRYIDPDQAKKIIKILPDNVEKIGVFADDTYENIKEITLKTGITYVQLHGDESVELCSDLLNLNIKLIKAIRIKNEENLSIINNYKTCTQAILLDTYSDKEYGGTGTCFNWEILEKAKDFNIPIILAGGVNLCNIDRAVILNPYAIDISSGVEISKGIKDHKKIKEIFNTAKRN